MTPTTIKSSFFSWLRCEITKHESGTDTWAEGHPCQCASCRAWVLLHEQRVAICKINTDYNTLLLKQNSTEIKCDQLRSENERLKGELAGAHKARESAGYICALAECIEWLDESAKSNKTALTLAQQRLAEAGKAKSGIYIASKTKNAYLWRYLRDNIGYPIISTWIDEADEGQTSDFADLWRRCISEASSAEFLILYRENDEVLKGGWIELGAALACGVTVYAVGIEEFTIAKDPRIKHFKTMKDAMSAYCAARDYLAASGGEKEGDKDA